MRPLAASALLTLLLLASASTAGCFEGDPTFLVTAYTDGHHVAPGGETHLVLLVENTGTFREDASLEVLAAPTNWSVTSEETPLGVNGGNASTLLLVVRPPPEADHGLHEVRVGVGDGEVTLHVTVTDLDGPAAREGVGARVRSVGFWDNGTVFWTNMKSVRDHGGVPMVWDEDLTYDVLKVYVGGERGEDPPEPYASEGYVPVIDGFDQRLRGMRGGETLAVRIPPEDAYTYAGNEDHALYGDALNFVVQVVAVDELEEEDELPVPPTMAEVPPSGGGEALTPKAEG